MYIHTYHKDICIQGFLQAQLYIAFKQQRCFAQDRKVSSSTLKCCCQLETFFRWTVGELRLHHVRVVPIVGLVVSIRSSLRKVFLYPVVFCTLWIFLENKQKCCSHSVFLTATRVPPLAFCGTAQPK